MINKNDCIVKIDQFEGPFDLLLTLIKEKKMDILSLDIGEITTQYITYIQQWKKRNLEIASEYLVMAANLLEIKSNELIPQESKKRIEDEETLKQKLIARLLEYKKIKDATEWLKKKELETMYMIPKPQSDLSSYEINEEDLPLPDYIDPHILQKVMWKIMNANIHLDQPLQEVNLESISISPEELSNEIIHYLKDRKNKSSLISDYFISKKTNNVARNKHYFLVGFVVILDLSFRNVIEINQNQSFSDIEMKLMEA